MSIDKLDKKKQPSLGWPVFVLLDIISFVFSVLPNLAAISSTLFFLKTFYKSIWIAILLSPIILFFSFIVAVYLLRLCLPKLVPGRYKKTVNKTTISWYCHFALGRAAKLSGLIHFLQAFYLTKFFYWRALGARVAYSITNSFDIDFVDAPLITIGKNVTIGSETSISCHSDIGKCLMLGKVVIEDDVFIGMSNTIGPNTTIKTGAWVGFGNALVNQVVNQEEKLKNIKPDLNSS